MIYRMPSHSRKKEWHNRRWHLADENRLQTPQETSTFMQRGWCAWLTAPCEKPFSLSWITIHNWQEYSHRNSPDCWRYSMSEFNRVIMIYNFSCDSLPGPYSLSEKWRCFFVRNKRVMETHLHIQEKKYLCFQTIFCLRRNRTQANQIQIWNMW